MSEGTDVPKNNVHELYVQITFAEPQFRCFASKDRKRKMNRKSGQAGIIVATTALSLMLAMEWSGPAAALDVAAGHAGRHDTSTGRFYTPEAMKSSESIRTAKVEKRAKERYREATKEEKADPGRKPWHDAWWTNHHRYLVTRQDKRRQGKDWKRQPD